MQQPLTGKKILLAEGDVRFSGLISQDLRQLGAEVLLARDPEQCLSIYDQIPVDALLCDLDLSSANGYHIVRRLRAEGSQLPIIILTDSQNHSDIAAILRLGVQDIILKPVIPLATLRSKLLAVIFPDFHHTPLALNQLLLDEWSHLRARPNQALLLLHQLQPPLRQYIAHCLVNYRHLRRHQEAGLLLDMEAVTPKAIAFYLIDTGSIGQNGVLGCFILRALFSDFLQRDARTSRYGIGALLAVLKKLNTALIQSGLAGEFPVVMGYYFTEKEKLVLLSAGVSGTLTCGQRRYSLRRGASPGLSEFVDAKLQVFNARGFQCRFSGKTSILELMLSRDKIL